MAGDVPIDDAADLGAFIRVARKAAGLTQDDLAEFVDADRVYVGRVERGSESRRLARVLRILHGLGYDLVISPRRPRPDPEAARGSGLSEDGDG